MAFFCAAYQLGKIRPGCPGRPIPAKKCPGMHKCARCQEGGHGEKECTWPPPQVVPPRARLDVAPEANTARMPKRTRAQQEEEARTEQAEAAAREEAKMKIELEQKRLAEEADQVLGSLRAL